MIAHWRRHDDDVAIVDDVEYAGMMMRCNGFTVRNELRPGLKHQYRLTVSQFIAQSQRSLRQILLLP